MDDILIHTNDNRPNHRKCIHRILDKLKKHDLYLKPEKCLFEQEEMHGIPWGSTEKRDDPKDGPNQKNQRRGRLGSKPNNVRDV